MLLLIMQHLRPGEGQIVQSSGKRFDGARLLGELSPIRTDTRGGLTAVVLTRCVRESVGVTVVIRQLEGIPQGLRSSRPHLFS
jgi:hypothetical protein